MQKIVVNERKIDICDICNKQIYYSRTHINDKDYCSDCMQVYRKNFTLNCKHEQFYIRLREYYTSKIALICDETFCNFQMEITENEMVKNKNFIELFKIVWNKKEKTKNGK